MSPSNLTRVAAELYAGSLSDFIARRNARAQQVDDPALAAGIRSLRKPSIAAWVVNVFAAERHGQLDEALRLAEELRTAQDDLDARALADLGRQRRALTQRLANEAAALAAARGERISAATVQAVHQTLSAAFFHPDAAAAVASGRLLRELEPGADLHRDATSAVGGGEPASAPQREQPADELRVRRERRDAERVVRAAEQAFSRAQSEQVRASSAQKDARERVETARAGIREREAELARARRDADAAQAAASDAERRVSAAGEAVDEAQRAVHAARERLDSTRSGG